MYQDHDLREDLDPQETQEWLEALDGVLKNGGRARTAFLMKRLAKHAARAGTQLPSAITTSCCNTIDPSAERAMDDALFMAVSYIHRTLPTICSV